MPHLTFGITHFSTHFLFHHTTLCQPAADLQSLSERLQLLSSVAGWRDEEGCKIYCLPQHCPDMTVDSQSVLAGYGQQTAAQDCHEASVPVWALSQLIKTSDLMLWLSYCHRKPKWFGASFVMCIRTHKDVKTLQLAICRDFYGIHFFSHSRWVQIFNLS